MKTLAALLLALVAGASWADSWPGPRTQEVFSASREYFVRVVPGESIGDTYGFAGAKKGKYASAEFYRRGADRSYRLVAEAALLNPVAPFEFFVSDDGRLATVDNWHNLGYGKVVVIYDAAGKLLRGYELRDLFGEERIETFRRSVSSIYWRQGPMYIQPDGSALLITLSPGTDLLFDLRTAQRR